MCQLFSSVTISKWYHLSVLSESVYYNKDRVVAVSYNRVLRARQLYNKIHCDIRLQCYQQLYCLRFSIFSVYAIFILLVAYAILNKLTNFITHVRKLVVLLNKFYCLYNARVSMQQIIIITTYNFVLQFLQYLQQYIMFSLNYYYKVKLL